MKRTSWRPQAAKSCAIVGCSTIERHPVLTTNLKGKERNIKEIDCDQLTSLFNKRSNTCSGKRTQFRALKSREQTRS